MRANQHIPVHDDNSVDCVCVSMTVFTGLADSPLNLRFFAIPEKVSLVKTSRPCQQVDYDEMK